LADAVTIGYLGTQGYRAIAALVVPAASTATAATTLNLVGIANP
jgi:hypothetical protein